MKKHLLSAKATMMMTFTGFLTVCWSLLSAQTVATNFVNNNASSVVVFSFVNTNNDAVIISDIGSVAGANNTYTAHLYARTVTYNTPTGAPGAISGANGWSVVGTNNSLPLTGNTTTNVAVPFISGMNYLVPGLTQVQFALQLANGASQAPFTTTAGSLRYSTVGVQTCTFSNSGCEIRACTGYGYGGTITAPTFTPRGFIGYINFTSADACAGSPAASNTIASASGVCVGESFNLSLSEIYSFSGITYQWQSSPDNSAWSDIVGAVSSTLSTTQTTDTWYRCVVTCTNSASSINSASVQVTQNAPTACYCTPGYTTGTTFGDLISAVSISGTTLDNNVGFTAGQPSYLDFFNSVLPNETGTLNAGSSYTVTVSTGEYGDQGVAAWIDFNNNGVFEVSEKIGSSATVIGSGFTPGQVNATESFVVSLPCNPTPGDYRMRIRCSWITNGPTIDPCATYTYGQAHDYKVTVAPPPPCPSISGLSAGTPASFNVLLNWNQGCAETAWNVEYGASGFTPGTGTEVAAGTNVDFDLTGLMSSTTYDIYVSADCGVDGESAPFGPITITTDMAPCAGTPTAANALSSSAVVCLDENFTLSLSETYDDLGITYQWQSSPDDMMWSDIIGAETPEFITTQTTDTYYRCVVTCTNSGLFMNSASVFVSMGNALDCYCTPEYTFGTDAGDLISAVSIAGTTLDNNVGFLAGQPSYLDFFNSVLPNQTGTMNAGTTYSVTVSTGEWGDQGIAAWIDFNNNGVFELTEKIGNTATVIGTGFTPGQVNATASFNLSIPCNPTPGDYRMRVRGAYFVNGPDIDPCALYAYGQTHDYKVTIGTPPPCPMISNLVASNVTSDAADLNWNIGCAETAWDIHISTSATPPAGAPDVVGHPTNSYSATMLMPDTEYFAHVRANCGGGNGESDYFTISFTTLPLPPPCANNVMTEPDVNCDNYPLTLIWDTVPEADGYLISLGTTPGGNEIAANFDIGGQVGIDLIDPTINTTYYWTVVPYNTAGNAVGCVEQMYTTGSVECACFPNYTFGKTDGDLISDVSITGTTLDNNTGTDPVNPFFTYFTGQPNYTADLLAGGSYSLNVTYGSFVSQNCAAWIDFNDNGSYEFSERIGFTGAASTVPFETVTFPISIGSNPTLGTFRMRIRNVFGVNGVDIDPCLEYGFGETEEYDVTIVPAPPGTVLNPTNSCGATDVTMNQKINAVGVPGALQYKFRITGTNSAGWPSDEFIYTTTSQHFRFQFIPGAMWGETYSVEVAYSEVLDVFGPYGSACNVTLQSLPTVPLSVVNPAVCGNSVSMNDFINTAWVPGAQAYRFQIVGTNAAGWPSDTYVQETTAPVRSYKFGQIPGALFGETYAVSVAFQDGSGNWTSYGAPCNITIVTPTTQLQAGDCGIVGLEGNVNVFADIVLGASGYRFRITGANDAMWPMDQITVDRDNRVFWMNLADGWLPGETYTIEVAVQDAAGNYGAYGASCSVTMAGAPTMPMSNVDASVNTKATIEGMFGATASHNPFTRDFGLQLVNANDSEAINVAIYDMSGKLIEASSVNPMDIESARFGANLATGMYMIQVIQGANQAVIRQVKN